MCTCVSSGEELHYTCSSVKALGAKFITCLQSNTVIGDHRIGLRLLYILISLSPSPVPHSPVAESLSVSCF